MKSLYDQYKMPVVAIHPNGTTLNGLPNVNVNDEHANYVFGYRINGKPFYTQKRSNNNGDIWFTLSGKRYFLKDFQPV